MYLSAKEEEHDLSKALLLYKARLLSTLEQFQNLISKSNSQTELVNLSLEFDQVLCDLERERYRYIDQSGSEGVVNILNRNRFNYRVRNEEFFHYFQSCAAFSHVWKQLLEPLKLSLFENIIDLCPGAFPKIELGLHYLGYRGAITAIDNDCNCLDQLIAYQKFFMPELNLECLNSDVYSAGKTLKAQLVTGNHILDDLVISDFCYNNCLSYSHLYQTEEVFLEHIFHIQNYFDQHQSRLANKISKMILSLIEEGGVAVLTQYPSVVEYKYNLSKWSERMVAFLNLIKDRIITFGYTDISSDLSSNLSFGSKRFVDDKNVIALTKKGA